MSKSSKELVPGASSRRFYQSDSKNTATHSQPGVQRRPQTDVRYQQLRSMSHTVTLGDVTSSLNSVFRPATLGQPSLLGDEAMCENCLRSPPQPCGAWGDRRGPRHQCGARGDRRGPQYPCSAHSADRRAPMPVQCPQCRQRSPTSTRCPRWRQAGLPECLAHIPTQGKVSGAERSPEWHTQLCGWRGARARPSVRSKRC